MQYQMQTVIPEIIRTPVFMNPHTATYYVASYPIRFFQCSCGDSIRT